MRYALELALFDDYPAFFRRLYADEGGMADGLNCDDRWEPRIRSLCEMLKGIPDLDFRFMRVVEVDGRLQIWANWKSSAGTDDTIFNAIEEACDE